VPARERQPVVSALDQELEQRTAALAPALIDLPGCGAIAAAKLLAEIAPIGRFTNTAMRKRSRSASIVAPLGRRCANRALRTST
jgi:transposase